MTPKSLITILSDRNRSLDERRYIVLTVFATFAFLASTISNCLIHEHTVECVVHAVMTLLTPLSLFICVKINKYGIGVFFAVFEILFVMMPVCFFYGGEIRGGLIPWFAFSFLYIGMVTRKHFRILALLGLIIESYVFFVESFQGSIIVNVHSYAQFYGDTLTSMFIVGIYIFVACWVIGYISEKESEYARHQAEQIEELNRSQNRFFSSMSHEIRTPINTIIGLNEMILKEAVTDEVAEDAASIQAASKMLLTTINDILDMSKIESGKMEIVPVVYKLGDLLSEVVGMVWMNAKEKGLEFKIDVDDSIPRELFGDEVRIKQILINVLNNAVKYTEKGSVSLAIRWVKGDDNKADIIFTIKDTGIGIKRESIPYLFTAFKRVDETKNRYIEGTGLGLAIVKEFVDLMGGEVSVNSIYTKGSEFVIRIPQGISDEKKIGEVLIESKKTMAKSQHFKHIFEAPDARVLIVDDNESNLMVAEKLLKDTKVKIDTALSGEEALRYTIHEKYDAIFMDHLMPEMDGIECFHAIHSQVGGYNKTTPIIALTANAGSDLKALYAREGFEGYVLKPVTGEVLEAELAKHLPKELIKFTNDVSYEMRAEVAKSDVKKNIIISSDSVCDVPKATLEHYEIPILPYHIYVRDGDFLDGLEAESDSVLSYIVDEEEEVQTDAPSVEEYEAFFAEQLSRAHSVIHITMAKYASTGYERALEAASTFDSVTVIDSGHLSGGMGMVVVHAARRAREGADEDTIISELEVVKKRVRTSCYVGNTDYLCKKGWVGKTANRVAKTLSLHPVMVLKRSRMKLGGFRVGDSERSIEKYVKSMLDTFNNIDKSMILVEYAGVDDDVLEHVKKCIKDNIKFEKIVIQKASSTIAANCGEGAVGLMYLMER